jgi:8-oxo-dGTP pyrophosphatase MutT (NUDIX family)
MAREERSAGVIVYRDEATRSRDGNRRTYLILDYGKHWDYAKGHVEAGEDDQTAALRELLEETGISDVQLFSDFRHEIVYFFRHPKRGLVRKTVVFFMGRTSRQRLTLSEEHEAYEFLPYDDARKRLTYATAKEVLRRAHEHLS